MLSALFGLAFSLDLCFDCDNVVVAAICVLCQREHIVVAGRARKDSLLSPKKEQIDQESEDYP